MVYINLSKLAALFAYDLKAISYKPIPGSSPPTNSANVSTVSPRFVLANDGSAPFLQPAAPVADASPSSVSTVQRRSWRGPLKRTSFLVNEDGTAETVDDASTTAAQDTVQGNCNVEPYDPPPIPNQEFPPYDQTSSNVYRYRQQQSVNLGSWFVHESWMTQSLFTCASGPKVAEIDIATGWGSPANARAVLERHWDTFITQSDFYYLSSIGINTVRLPIGYWSLGPNYVQGTPFEAVSDVYTNAWPRVLRAVNQAGNAGIGVLIDLHGAPGSQNGQPHSGISDGQTNLFSVPANVDKAIAVLTFLTQTFALVNNVVGIQILNEPAYGPGLEDFYTKAISAMRNVSEAAQKLPLYMHDGFDIDRFSNFLSSRTDFVVQDHHSYFVFTPSDNEESGTNHTADVEGAISQSLVQASTKIHRNLVVDEYSCALSPDSLKNEQDAEKVRQTFCTDQIKVYSNATAGWSFWAYKKEDCEADAGWCFTASVGKSLPKTFFSYGKPTTAEEASTLAEDARNLLIPISADVIDLVQKLTGSLLRRRSAFYGTSFYGLFRAGAHHRFEAIHQRTDDSSSGSTSRPDPDAMKNSTARGYTDGFTTAKIFASCNSSRLGFTGQFVADAIKVAGPLLIAEGTEKGYSAGFLRGLKHGEDAVEGKT
ncbi:glycoside hydrolase [Agrocybe pediades]|nr:glycoside hydrolase [Agrocybe pediades]